MTNTRVSMASEMLTDMIDRGVSIEQISSVACHVLNLQEGFVFALFKRSPHIPLPKKVILLVNCYDTYVPRIYGKKYFVKCYINIIDFCTIEHCKVLTSMSTLHKLDMCGIELSENIYTIFKIWKRCHSQKISADEQKAKLLKEMEKAKSYELEVNLVYRQRLAHDINESLLMGKSDYSEKTGWLLEWQKSGKTIEEFNKDVSNDMTETKIEITFTKKDGTPETHFSEARFNTFLWKFRSYAIIENIVEGLQTNSMTPNILDAYNECAQEWFTAQLEVEQDNIVIITENAKTIYEAVKLATNLTAVRKKKSRKKKKVVRVKNALDSDSASTDKSLDSEDEFLSAEEESDEEILLQPKECMFCGKRISSVSSYNHCSECASTNKECDKMFE